MAAAARGSESSPARQPRVYLDHAATSTLRPAAREAWLAESERTGNPAAWHTSGRATRARLEDSREQIAAVLGARPDEVIFTSGGSESDTLGVLGAHRASPQRPVVVTSAVEHPAVSTIADRVPQVRVVGVAPDGVVDLPALSAALDDTVGVVSIQAVNSETGIAQPMEAVVECARRPGVSLHSDLVQGLARQWSFSASGLDLASVSAHKIGGPIGIGALLARREAHLAPTGLGAGQEREVRSGTQMVALAAGFAAAVGALAESREVELQRQSALRHRIERAVSGVPDVGINSGPDTVAHIVSVTVPGAGADELVVLLDTQGIDVSVGTACRAGVHRPSQVLLAMGRSIDAARSSIRISLGWNTTEADVDAFCAALPDVVERARAASAGAAT